MSTFTLFDTIPMFRPRNKSITFTSPLASDMGRHARRLYRMHRRMGANAYTARLAAIGGLAVTHLVTTATELRWDQ